MRGSVANIFQGEFCSSDYKKGGRSKPIGRGFMAAVADFDTRFGRDDNRILVFWHHLKICDRALDCRIERVLPAVERTVSLPMHTAGIAVLMPLKLSQISFRDLKASRLFLLGNGSFGSAALSARQSGAHPSPTSNSNSRSCGTVFLTEIR